MARLIGVLTFATLAMLAPPAAGARTAVPVHALRFQGVVRQGTDRSCGYAAAATVLRALGLEVDEAQLIRAATGQDGETSASVSDIGRAVAPWGVRSYPVLSTWDDLLRYFERYDEPVVALVDVGRPHFTVVAALEPWAAYLADPSQGARVWSRARFEERWTGVVLFLRLQDGGPPSGFLARSPLMQAVGRLKARHRLLERAQTGVGPVREGRARL
ncbi:MAG: hypothetical protein GX496_02485 [Firmicutes bacterium]|nr:hypothetical protein [Bacillota bacterium]